MFVRKIKYTQNMAKRGRKPKEKKGYFYESEEAAIVDYINETNLNQRNIISIGVTAIWLVRSSTMI